jgi:hypothetical protein
MRICYIPISECRCYAKLYANLANSAGDILGWKRKYLKVKDRFILRPTVSWPVCSGIRPPFGNSDQYFFLSTGTIFGYLLFF